VEDYLANRKGKQQGAMGGSLFGQTPAATQASNTGFSFGQPAASANSGFSEYRSCVCVCVFFVFVLLGFFWVFLLVLFVLEYICPVLSSHNQYGRF
jgi:hypothetical protein